MEFEIRIIKHEKGRYKTSKIIEESKGVERARRNQKQQRSVQR